MNVQITGASGSGKTYLGKNLAKILNCNFVDTDDILWVWGENVQPYTVAVNDEDSYLALKKELDENDSTVASGMFYPWSVSLIPRFDLLIIIETSKEIRRKRIIDREYEMYGDRFIGGNDMAKQFSEFLEWAMSYDTSNDKLGSRIETDRWIQKFKCDVLYINGDLTIDEKLKIVLNKILDINNRMKEVNDNDNSKKIKKR